MATFTRIPEARVGRVHSLRIGASRLWMGVSGAHNKPSALCQVGETDLTCFGKSEGFSCVRGVSNTTSSDDSPLGGKCRRHLPLEARHDTRYRTCSIAFKWQRVELNYQSGQHRRW